MLCVNCISSYHQILHQNKLQHNCAFLVSSLVASIITHTKELAVQPDKYFLTIRKGFPTSANPLNPENDRYASLSLYAFSSKSDYSVRNVLQLQNMGMGCFHQKSNYLAWMILYFVWLLQLAYNVLLLKDKYWQIPFFILLNLSL